MNHIIGIDISKAKLDVLWLKDPATLKVKTKIFTNDRAGHTDLLIWLTKQTGGSLNEIHVVMEATGIYHETLAHWLFDHQVNVSVLNPAHARDFAKGLGTVHKTDKKDSLLLARYGVLVKPALWQPERREIRELKALIGRLNALEKDLQREQNRLEKTTFTESSGWVLKSLQRMISGLETEQAVLEKEIDDHINRHPDLKKDMQLLRSIPGVGPVLSRVMLSVIRSRQFKTASECAAFLGVIPKLKESGIFRGKTTLSKKGPPLVRAKLYMPAIVASQHNPSIKAHTERMLLRGKTKMQALGAAMRKLVHQCFGVLKHQTEYSPQAG